MKLSQYIPEIKIHPRYKNNKELYILLKNELDEFLIYIDKKYNWYFKKFVKQIHYDNVDDLILLILKSRGKGAVDYISVDKNQLDNINNDDNSEHYHSGVDKIEYKNLIFYII